MVGVEGTIGAGDVVAAEEIEGETFAGWAGAAVTASAEAREAGRPGAAGALADSAARAGDGIETAGRGFSAPTIFLALRAEAGFTAAVLGFAERGALGAPEAERDDGLTRTDVRRAASFLKRSRQASSTELRGVAA